MDQDSKGMKLKDAQLLTKYTTMKNGVLHYQDVPVDDIPLGTWELLEEREKTHPITDGDDMQTFLQIMIARAKKKA